MGLRGLIVTATLGGLAGTMLGYVGPGSTSHPALAQGPSPTPSTSASPSPTATGAVPTQVVIAFRTGGPGQAEDPCKGAFRMDNEIGDHDVIAACTYDDLGHPVPTDVSGFSLRWSVEASPGTREVGVRFNPENPPTETSGPEAIAHAEIDAVAAGDNEIAATLLNPNGYVVDSWFVEKHICCHEAPPEVPTVITAHRASRSIYGVVRSQEDYCISGRPVELFRRRKGYPAESIGSDVSGSAGRWRVKTGRRPGIYYARVYTEIPIEGGADFYCLEDQSRDVRRR